MGARPRLQAVVPTDGPRRERAARLEVGGVPGLVHGALHLKGGDPGVDRRAARVGDGQVGGSLVPIAVARAEGAVSFLRKRITRRVQPTTGAAPAASPTGPQRAAGTRALQL